MSDDPSTEAALKEIVGDAPIEGYLEQLATSHELPRVAIGICLVRFREATPALRGMLERAAGGESFSDDDARLFFRSLYILGDRRDAPSFPTFLRFLRRPQAEIEYLLGDLITEDLSRIAAGLFDGDADSLFAAIADRSIDEFVRYALWGAATFHCHAGRIDRTRLAAFIQRFYDERLADDWDYAWIGWQEAVAYAGLAELRPLVERAWGEGRIAEDWGTVDHFVADLDRALREPDDPKRFEDRNLGYIEDVVETMEWTSGDDSDSDSEYDSFAPLEPAVNPYRHVGRNDSCPCGSGLKFKKCCLLVLE